MPVYEYICEACSAKFELLIRSQSDKPACEKCGSADIRQLFSLFGMKSGGAPSSSGG